MQFCHFCQVGDKMGYTKSHSSLSLSLSLSLSFFMKLCLPAFESQIKHDWNRGLLPDPNPRVPKYCRVSGRVSG